MTICRLSCQINILSFTQALVVLTYQGEGLVLVKTHPQCHENTIFKNRQGNTGYTPCGSYLHLHHESIGISRFNTETYDNCISD